MKSLSKIIAHYLFTAVLILLMTLFFNVFLYIVTAFQIVHSSNNTASTSAKGLSEELRENDGVLSMTEQGKKQIDEQLVFAMLLDDEGTVIWSYHLPEDITKRHYTASEISVFSKWYLNDYPVICRVTDYGLLVAGAPKGSLFRYNIIDSMEKIDYTLRMIPTTLILNLILVLLLVIVWSVRFYRSLRTIALGLDALSKEAPICLPEKGMTQLLAKQLNQTSRILTKQREHLAKRDDARTTWISSVSHDIRTPLSLIMGYAASLKNDCSLSEEQRHTAELMEYQSIQIKHLIEDLNLTSKLEYDMQPLRRTTFLPARLLRAIVSDCYNQGLLDTHTLELSISKEVESIQLDGDTALLTRAFHNLIQNSIRHNPGGCQMQINASMEQELLLFQYTDDGCGIPDNVIASLNGTLSDNEKAPHIMGLRIVFQIFKAHDWKIQFSDRHTILIHAKIVESATLKKRIPEKSRPVRLNKKLFQ